MSKWWQGYPWRLIQTNLREIDMLDISAEQVVRDMQAFDANILMINAAGIIASYPTDLPFHFQSPYLQGDSLAEIIDACHAADIRVFARTDFSKVRRPIYEANPEWAYVSPSGEIVDYNGDVACCLNGGFQQVYMFKILEELLSTHDFDGIFFNMGGYQTSDYSGNYYGPCQCANCRRLFFEMFGLDLPVVEDMDDPVFRKYHGLQEPHARMPTAKKSTTSCMNAGPISASPTSKMTEGFVRQENNTAIKRAAAPLAVQRFRQHQVGHRQLPRQSLQQHHRRLHRLSLPPRGRLAPPAEAAPGPGAGQRRRTRLLPHRPAGQPRGSLGLCAGQGDVRLPRRQRGELSRADFQGQHRAAQRPVANQDEFRGWFRFLIEGHFLFDTLMESAALDLPWDRYDAVILPDFQPVSDALARKLDDFVAAGGTLIASGRSSFRDENFEPRALPALTCLGMTELRLIRQDMTSSYFKFE